jgi:hypothetical protein
MKKELERLRKLNPNEKFRISYCKHTKKEVIQLKEGLTWTCLH